MHEFCYIISKKKCVADFVKSVIIYQVVSWDLLNLLNMKLCALQQKNVST